MSSLEAPSPVKFILPAQSLLRYVSTYYFFKIENDEAGEQEDLLHPEWASAHFTLSGSSRGSIVSEPPVPTPPANLTGPTIKASRIFCGSMFMAGIGILPLGWYRLVPCPADRWANGVGDLNEVPEFGLFKQIWDEMQGMSDPAEMAVLFNAMLIDAITGPDPLENDIENLHMALANPDIRSVADLSEVAGISQQRLERLSRRVFGFPPKRLLRRQRFLRTLGNIMLDPDLKWSAALDDHYFDQAHFNRDFKEFMGMSPGKYLAMPRPISIPATLARATHVGHPLQALQGPGFFDQ
ncbi:MAG: helix-turn-helix domain-containing protein [Sphingorhabdus sp.]